MDRKQKWRNNNKEYIKKYNEQYRRDNGVAPRQPTELKHKSITKQSIFHLYTEAQKIEVKKAYDRNYRRCNREREKSRRKNHDNKRRALKHGTSTSLTHNDKQLIDNLYTIARGLSKANGVDYHVDHRKPLSKGGEHQWYNLQIITAEENLRKSDIY